MCCDNFITLLLFLTLLLLLFIFIIYLLLLHFYYLELYLTIKFFEKSSPFLLLTLLSLVIPKAVQSRRERRKERIITLISRKKNCYSFCQTKTPKVQEPRRIWDFKCLDFSLCIPFAFCHYLTSFPCCAVSHWTLGAQFSSSLNLSCSVYFLSALPSQSDQAVWKRM